MQKHSLLNDQKVVNTLSTKKFTNFEVIFTTQRAVGALLSLVLIFTSFSVVKAQVADFTADIVSGVSPTIVHFTDASTGGVTSWFWNFGNGNTSTLQNPAAVYVSPGDYTVTLTVSDGANNNTKTEINLITIFSNTSPQVSISAPATDVNAAFIATFTFNEDVTGFELSDINVSNGTASNLTPTSASIYTATITPTTDGALTIDVPVNAVLDLSSEGNPPAAQLVVTADFIAPSIVISSAAIAPVTADFTATFTFSEDVTGFDLADIVVANGIVSNLVATSASVYTANIGLVADGALTIDVGVNIAGDLAGNSNTAATQFSITANAPSLFTDGPIQLMVRVREIKVTNAESDLAFFGVVGQPDEYNFKLWARDDASFDNEDWVGGDLLIEDFIPPGNTTDFNDVFYSVTYPTSNVPQFLDLRLEAWEDDATDQVGGVSSTTSRNTYDTNFCAGGVVFGVCVGVTTSDDNYFLGDAFVSGLDYRQGTEGVWFDHGFLTGSGTGVNGYQPRIETFWQRVTPATTDLGTITVGTTAVSNGDNTSSSNSWPALAGNDVLHSFTITEELGVGIALSTSFGAATTYLIDNEGTVVGTGSNSTPISVADLAAGTYSVIVDANSSASNGTFTLTVGAIKSEFTLNPDIGCAVPHAVFFTDQSTLLNGANTSWSWNFGDAGNSTLQNPFYNYLAAGTYTVVLTVTDNATGAKDTHTETVSVAIPTADFTGAPLFGCGPLTVNFTDGSTTSAGTTVTDWSWDFGDGGTSTDQSPTYVYDTPGIYTVTLTTTNSLGCTDTRTRVSYVQVIGPDVDFTSTTATIGGNPLTVSFQDRTIFGAPITGWTWDFGDGGTSNLQNPSHTYNTTGTFNVSLTVTDIDGCSRTLTKTNFVNTIPGAFDISNGIYTGDEDRFSVLAEDFFPNSLAFNNDGTKMFVMGTAGDDINEYALGIAYDVSTAVYSGDSERFSVASQESNPRSLAFNNDGTKMFVMGSTGDDINEYNLTTAFDVSTAVFAGNGERFSVASEETGVTSLAFNSDGTKMFVLGFDNKNVNEYSLGTAFDVSTAVYAGNGERLSVSAEESFLQSLAFSKDGYKMYIMGNFGDDINEYNLTTAFDVSTAVFAGNAERFSVATQENTPFSLAFNGDGTKVYVVGEGSDHINEYSLASPVITGAVASQAVNEDATINTFAAIVVADPNGDNISATILLDDNAKGVLTGTGLTGSGPYTLAGTDAASLQTALRALVFDPTDNRSAVSETTNFTLTLNDGSFSDTDNITTVVSSAVAPTVTISSVASDPVNSAFIATFTFSEDVTGFVMGDITGGNGTVSNFASTSANVYTATITPTTDGAVTIDVAANVAEDGGTAGNTAGTQFNITADLTSPTVTITSAAADPIDGAFTATFTFSEAVTGFGVGDITVGNGTAGTFNASSSTVYTAEITPTTDGALTIDINANVAQDAATNGNTAATQFSIEADLSAPTVTITSVAADPIDGAFTATFTFSEAVTGFAVGDITVGNGTAGTFNAVSSSVYTAQITPTTDGTVTIDMAANVSQDVATNGNTAATQFSIEADLTDPTVTITSSAADPIDGAFSATFTFSEAVTGFEASDITVGNGSAGTVSATSNSVYTSTITPTTDGTVTIDVNANIAQDAATNGNTAATQFSITADLTDPTVTITSAAADPIDGAFTATFTFSEAVTGFGVGDITVGNGTAGTFNASSSTVYTAEITPTTDGALTIDINANVAQDAATNGNTAATQFSIEADLSAPTVTITSVAADPIDGAFTATFTFSEAVTGFAVGDITVGNGTAGTFNAVSSSVYTAQITPTTDGTVTIDMAANVSQDVATNGNTAATQFSIEADLTDPTVTITSSAADPIDGAFSATFTFSEAVTGFEASDITVGNGSAGTVSATSNSVYTSTITPTTDGTVTIDVNANIAQDAATNGNTAATQFSIEADLTAPTITISSSVADPVDGAFTATFTFSEAVTGFAIGDITVGNGTAGKFNASSSTVYTAEIIPTTDGALTIDINANVAQDAATNGNTAATQFSIEADLTAPTITISSSAADPIDGAFTATFTFSEAVTGFAVGDITVGNGSTGFFSALSSTVYTAEITPTTDGALTIDINANVAQDAATNGNTAATQFSIEADLSAPTVSITSAAADPIDGAFTATFTFSEAVTGFAVGDITVGNGTAGTFNSSSPSVYTAEITPTTNGTVTIDINGNVAQDAATNGNTAATQFSIEADLTSPTVMITSSAANPIDGAFTATFTFSEAVTGFAIGDITVGNGSAGSFSALSSTVYTGQITPTTDGTVTIDIAANVAQDAATNGNIAAIQFSIEADLSAPTVTITSGAADPIDGAFTATFTFSEAVTGFAVGDIIVGNGTAGTFNVLSSTVYTAEITPTTDGTVTIDIAANVAQDAATNGNTAATQFSITADLTDPTVTITSAAADPVDGAFTATFTFSEAVTGFAVGDIIVGNGTAGTFNVLSSTVYTAEITPTTDGTVTIDIAANVAQDAATNGNTAATQFSIEADLSAPTVTITSAPADPIDGAFTATFTFSEAVTGFAVGDITVGNGSAGSFSALSSTVYTAEVTPTTDGTVTIDVNADVSQDAATNGNTAATQFSIEADLTSPIVTITSSAADPIDGAFTATFTFSEAVTGFAIGDITVGNGSAGSFSALSSTVYTAQITPATDGTVTIDINAGVAQDAATNDNTAAIQFSIEADLSSPSVTITSAAADPIDGAFTATFTFSEVVTGFAVGDITVGNGSAGSFSASSGTVYTAEITPTTDGILTIDVNANVAQDAATNGNRAAAQFSIEADLSAPNLTISSAAADPIDGAFTATFTFSEAVTGFAVDDITVGNGSTSSFSASSSTVYTAEITPATDGTVTIDINAGVAQDAATNDNTAAIQFSIEADLSRPSVTITSAPADPIDGAFTATFTFSEAVTGFAVGDITVGNGSAGSFSALSSTVYTAEVTPTTDGTVTIDVNADVSQDAATNGNTAATQFSIEADLTSPIVTITSSAVDPIDGNFIVTLTFSELVTGFESADIATGNATISNFSSTGATVYTATITPVSDGAVTVDVAANVALDVASNGNVTAPQFSIEADLTAPQATLTSAVSGIVNSVFELRVSYTEEVTGFELTDLQTTNGVLSNFTAVEVGKVWTIEVTPLANGPVEVSLPSGIAADAAGNPNEAATLFSIVANLTMPSLIISSTDSDLTKGPITASFSFSEIVTGFTIDDISVDNGTASNFSASSGSEYTASITPATDGPMTINVATNVAQDIGMNGNMAASQFSIVADLTSPELSVLGIPVEVNTTAPFTLLFEFTEEVTGFTESDLVLTNASLTSLTPSGARSYNAIFAANGLGDIGINIAALQYADLAGNLNSDGRAVSIKYNSLPGNISLSLSSIDENNSLGDQIAVLATEDLDPGDVHTYSLVSGTGDDDNSAFAISLDKLRAAMGFDFEDQAVFSIRLKTDDGNGGVFEKAFTININNVNEIPTDLDLDNTLIDETDNTGVLIANLSATDPDSDETFTYSLVAGAGSEDNTAFNISGNQLISAQPFNFEEKAMYNIRLRVSDQGGLAFEKSVELAIIDVELEPLRDFTLDRPDARIKNFFTPNGDGQNDVWVIDDIRDNPVNLVKVYSQGGELVFSTENYQNNWGGTFKGEDLRSGYYYYEINIFNGQSIIRGMLLILNNK